MILRVRSFERLKKTLWKSHEKLKLKPDMHVWWMFDRFWIDFRTIWSSFLDANWRRRGSVMKIARVTCTRKTKMRRRQEKCSSREAPGSAKIDLQICYGVPKVLRWRSERELASTACASRASDAQAGKMQRQGGPRECQNRSPNLLWGAQSLPKASEIKQKLKKIRIDKPLLNGGRRKVDFYWYQMQKNIDLRTGFENKITIDEMIANIQKH